MRRFMGARFCACIRPVAGGTSGMSLWCVNCTLGWATVVASDWTRPAKPEAAYNTVNNVFSNENSGIGA
jgi:hypothetical protein